MNIALWGYGLLGQTIHLALEHGLSQEVTVTAIFDRSCLDIAHALGTGGIEVRHPDCIKGDHASGLFDAVFVAIAAGSSREGVARQLEDWDVPSISWEEIESVLWQEAEGDRGGGSLGAIMSRMQDQESRDLFKARVHIDLTMDEGPFLDVVERYDTGGRFIPYDLMAPMRRAVAQRVILVGGGADGIVNCHALRLCRVPLAALCSPADTSWGGGWDDDENVPCILPADLVRTEYDDCLVVMSSREARAHWCELEGLGVPGERMYDPPGYRPLLNGARHRQYFDVWRPGESEVFVDCGAYDGETIIDFNNWCAGSYKKVFALEPMGDMQGVLKKRLGKRRIHDVTLLPVAAWNRCETISFDVSDGGASSAVFGVDGGGSVVSVQADALDNLIDEPITFLKMDIEGSEMAALDGAERLIRAHRPRLAICVYHKPLDIVALAQRVIELCPEYRFWVRHYGAGLYETVLYASVGDGDEP